LAYRASSWTSGPDEFSFEQMISRLFRKHAAETATVVGLATYAGLGFVEIDWVLRFGAALIVTVAVARILRKRKIWTY
jgi:hypothetical protein